MEEKLSRVRRAREEDIGDLLRLLVQVDMVHHNGRPDLFKGPATKYGEEELRVLLRDPDRPVFVYPDENDRVLGYAFCILKREKADRVMTDIRTLYIDDLCVEETARGRGIGRTLYEYAVSYAKEAGCHNLTLNVWSCNPSALRFYRGLGLKEQKIGMEVILEDA